MMSEEEEEGDTFIRHKPSWRSDTLNQFLEKLESCFKDKHPKSLAKPRKYGEPVEKNVPSGIPSWMIKANEANESLNSNNSESDGENTEKDN